MKVTPIETNRGRDPRLKNIAGTRDYSMAEVMMGILRNIEHVSRADHAYITALEHSVQHGFGFFRMQPVWTRNDSFEQEIKIFRVKNSYSVLLDPTAQEVDYSDMQDCFIHTMINREQFERRWPNARASSFESNEQGNTYEGWYDREMLRIAEYFWIDYTQDDVLLLNDGSTGFRSRLEPILDELKRDQGIYVVNDRPVKRPQCKWQKMTATDILEGPVVLPTQYVPVFPVLGRELIIDGETRYHSAIRHAKDAQKAYNYWQTAASESVALAPRAPWILTGKQIEGWEGEWEEANRRNLPFLLYNHQEGVPPPQRIFADQGAIAQLQQAAQQHQVMQDIIGMHEANVGAASNERSGVAVRERAARGELSTYAFADNLARAIEHMGRVALEMIPTIYNSQRVMRIQFPDETDDFVEINQTIRDEQTGKDVIKYDIGYGRYDVTISTDPSFATQRQEAQQNILETMQRLPPDKVQLIAHLLVKNMDFPGADEMYDIMRKTLPDELKTPDELAADLPPGVVIDEESGQAIVEETGEPWQKPPTPAEQIALAEQQAETEKHKATQADAGAKTKQAEAKIAEANAKMAELGQAGQQGDPEAAAQFQGQIMQEVERMVREIVDIAMQEHQDDTGAHEAMGVEDQITDAIVSALNRVKRYTDSQVGAQANPEASGTEASAGQGAAPVVVQTGDIETPKIRRIKFNVDGDHISEAVPEYEEAEAVD